MVWKMRWQISQLFTRALDSLEIETLMESFNPKWKKYEVKIYRGVMRHDNEEWCKISSGINLLFQNWQVKFDKMWPKYLKVSKIFTLMCFFWAKYIVFERKRYRGVIFHETEELYKIWRENHLSRDSNPQPLSS